MIFHLMHYFHMKLLWCQGVIYCRFAGGKGLLRGTAKEKFPSVATAFRENPFGVSGRMAMRGFGPIPPTVRSLRAGAPA